MQLYLEPLTACPRLPSGQRPGLFLPRGPRSSLVLGSGVTGTGRRLRMLGRGHKAVVEWWAPCALTPLPARWPSTARGALYFCGPHLDPVTIGSRVHDREMQPRIRCWGRGVHVGRCVSAGVERSLLLGCARVMGVHSSGILFAGRRQWVF